MDRRLRPALEAAALLVLAAVAGCVPVGLQSSRRAPEPAPGAADCPATQGQAVLEEVNQLRARRGLRPLIAELRLHEAAQRHTADQADHSAGDMGHVGSDGSSSGERAARAGYRWGYVAENVGAGYPTAPTIVAGWMQSPGHRAIMLAPEPLHAGVGYVHRPGGRLRHYWTLLVAAPRDGATVRAVACHP